MGKLGKPGGSGCGSGGRFPRSVVTVLALAALAVAALALPAGAGAHAERATFFPDPDQGAFPEYRTTGPALVVCADDTKQRIKRFHGKRRATLQRQLKDCAYDSIQAAVNDAQNGTRILVMPGVYDELDSRGPAPAGCEDVYQRTEAGQFALTYDEHRQCPQRSEPDRDPRRHERRPHLRRQVQHPDRGHRIPAGRHRDRGASARS